ncbi:MAG: hypothetical protein ABF868_08325 [Sporolactobacillus sp.]
MNFSTAAVLLLLGVLYYLAIRSVCKNGACADCGARGLCPAHQLQKAGMRKPSAERLSTARRLASGAERPALIVERRASHNR